MVGTYIAKIKWGGGGAGQARVKYTSHSRTHRHKDTNIDRVEYVFGVFTVS